MELVLVVLVLIIVGGGYYLIQSNQQAKRSRLEDAKAEARRWLERLGGQVLNLTGTDTASQQAIADASERYNAAGSQMEQAQTEEQAKLVKETALEGLYYVRAAREAMGLDPGPALPEDRERQAAGKVTEHRSVDVEGKHYEASPQPSSDTPHYYPGGRVAGRPVPQGWYSEPWWKPALVAGAWGLGSMMLFSTMFAGMAGVPSGEAWADGYSAGQEDAMSEGGDGGGGDAGDGGGDMGGDAGGDMGGDFGGGDMGDMGGFDFGF
ncbi:MULTISPECIES: hypothetical protein [Prauserella salsuginis group]|uniref:DUF1542 domain-containing protein n=2 Tax=Prauserella salsuginis group TaxID=2893672 RepID=A0A839XK49_9PSEU|nr:MULTISPECIES: hypothetical protein [Prauserella salsuginis group]MBB3664302.1 hypothetical protein [Prauserella sediminis]MCR3721746.1 hypothetical protein [Prauserella flava]MCR3734437.1 hypothetical protein [Prauserella salsuginis]